MDSCMTAKYLSGFVIQTEASFLRKCIINAYEVSPILLRSPCVKLTNEINKYIDFYDTLKPTMGTWLK